MEKDKAFAYKCVHYFCQHADAVVMLTATPLQTSDDDLYTLLNLLRPDVVIDKKSFTMMSRPNPYISQCAHIVRAAKENWKAEALETLDSVLTTQWGENVIANNPVFEQIRKVLRQDTITREERVKLITDIESLHSFNMMLNRTRRKDIQDFCIRRTHTLESDFTDQQRELHDALLTFEVAALSKLHGGRGVKFMMSTIRRQAASCIFGLAPHIRGIIDRRFEQMTDDPEFDFDDGEFSEMDLETFRFIAKNLLEMADNLPEDDPKFDGVLQIIREKQKSENNKIILFSTFRYTLYYIKRKLREAGFRVEQIDGSVKNDDRLDFRARFELPKDDPEAIDIMLFTEVGSEGLDYQFCDMMINYDLPWNPMRIEQRIGRIDRRGQGNEVVNIYNIITSDTVDADIYDRCLSRIGVFEGSIGECEEILGEIGRQIELIALDTIVPLRTAASKILREQMVGRGLRLPYGERTGDRDVDAVMLTAHDKFNDILAEAQKGDSIFKAGNVIKAEEIKPEEVVYTQLTIETNPDAELEKAYAHTQIEKTDATDALLKKATELIQAEVEEHIQHTPAHTVTPTQAQQIVETVKQKVAEDKDLGQTFKENEMPLAAWMLYQTEETHRAAVNKFIPIPRIKVTDAGVEEYVFVDFDLDMADFTHVPIKNELLVQNLEDMQDRQRIKGDAIDFEGYNPKKVILEQLRAKPEIDYEKCSKLLFKLITQVCDHYETRYGTNGMQNIIMMYKRDIGNKIYKQMLQHFYCENGFLQEEVVGTRDYNLQQSYSCAERVNLFSDDYTGNIQSVLFEGVKRGVFSAAKFDSRPELVLARVLETDTDVQNWLRPAPQEFNITYNHGHNYEPDFVVETDDTVYLVEVKGEDKLSDPDVIAKKKRGIQYCEVASRWGKANGYKQWRYLFIPSKQIMPNSSFMQLAKMFQTM